MRIGAMQMRLSTDLKTNLKTIENGLVKAADHGVEVLNFPETCLTGYLFDSFLDVKNEDIAGSIDYLAGLSQEKGVSIIVGTPFWDNKRCFNSVAVLLADGRRYMYHKINLVSYEQDYFVPGSETVTFTINQVTFGTIICRDQNFPALARRIKDAGAQVLFISCAHFYSPPEARLKIEKNRALPIVRAYENGIFVCKANAIGTFRGKINLGHSIIVAPNGVVISEAGETQEEMLFFDIDPAFDWRWAK
jgi:predicted amidohydrolase